LLAARSQGIACGLPGDGRGRRPWLIGSGRFHADIGGEFSGRGFDAGQYRS
jgi:hypothetical protein